MARGQQKIQSQQKAAEKTAKQKKQQGHSLSDQKAAASVALKNQCVICKRFGIELYTILTYSIVIFAPFYSQMPDPKTYKQHFENKHPKNDLPEELKEL